MSEAHPEIAHGGLVAAELGALRVAPSDVLDLSVNVNPYGPCASVRAAIASADLQAYPDPTAAPARRALAAWLGVGEERVVVGNGAVDLLWGIARAVLLPGDTVLAVEPTFSEMRAAAERVGADVHAHVLTAERDFALDLDELDGTLSRTRPRLVYACTPANPTGRYVDPTRLARLAERHPGTLFIVDVSFLSLSAHHAEAPWRVANHVVWLKSLTKDHGLAGLRIGCAIAPASVAARVEAARPPWTVNALAQAAAIAITTREATSFVDTSRRRLLDDCRDLTVALERLDLRVHGTDTVFALVDLGVLRSGTSLRSALLRRHHVLVRDCSSFGLPHHIRVAARAASDRDRFLHALSQVLSE